jgi:hypothetical protein
MVMKMTKNGPGPVSTFPLRTCTDLDACSKPECPLQISAKHGADFFLKNNADTVQSVSLYVKEGTTDHDSKLHLK